MEIIVTLVVGLIVGAIAKFLMPGPDPGGWIITIVLGIAGSFVGNFVAGLLGMAQPVGWIGSILGAMLLEPTQRRVVGGRVAGNRKPLHGPVGQGEPEEELDDDVCAGRNRVVRHGLAFIVADDDLRVQILLVLDDDHGVAVIS